MFLPQLSLTKKREVGTLSLFWVGVSGAIGGGVFVLIGQGASLVGAWIPLAFILAGLIVMASALIYSELAASLPAPGGVSAFFINSFGHSSASFLVAWIALAGLMGLAAINGIAFGAYLNGLGVPVASELLGLGLVIGGYFLVRRGVANVIKLGLAMGIIISIVFISYSWFGIQGVESPSLRVVSETGGSINPLFLLAAVALVYAAFVGYEGMIALAGKAKNPGRTLPRALLGTTLFIAILYSVLAYAVVAVVGSQALAQSSAPLLDAARPFGNSMTILIFASAVVATVSSYLASLTAASYGITVLAEEGLFPEFVGGRTDGSMLSPRAVLFVALIVSGLLLAGSVRLIASLESGAFLVELIAACAAIIALRNKRPFLKRPFRMPFGLSIPFIIGAIALIFLGFLGPIVHFILISWLALGLFFYFIRFVEQRRFRIAMFGAVALIALVLLVLFLSLVFI